MTQITINIYNYDELEDRVRQSLLHDMTVCGFSRAEAVMRLKRSFYLKDGIEANNIAGFNLFKYAESMNNH
jgi:hypothetical protein